VCGPACGTRQETRPTIQHSQVNSILRISTVAALALSAFGIALASDSEWPYFGGDPGAERFSRLRQINTSNVQNLKVAWVYHTGDNSGNTPIECTPLVVDGTMYLVTAAGRIAALDPATGVERWSYESHNDPTRSAHQKASRGLAYWRDRKNPRETRILYGTPDGRILSINAKTGRPDPSFHSVDLRAELGPQWKDAYVGVSAAPTICRDLVYVGIANGEDEGAAPGNIMAFDVRSGKRRWNFDVFSGAGGAGAWNGYVLDERRGILFAATGSATPDFDGSGRSGDNLYANCVLALNATTGKLLWHFQTVHHDLWDHDNASTPILCRVRRNGKDIDAVAQVTKTGFCFLFDRVTGKPLFDVREVPAERIDGGSPTQPEPVLPPALTETLFTDEKITDLSPEARAAVSNALMGLSYGRKYLLPTRQGTVVAPGYLGGSPWSGASFDPRRNLLFVNTNNLPSIVANPANYRFLVDDQGYPGIKPPWGNLTAIDLNTGQFAWRNTLGEYPELTAKHIPPTGTVNFGGTLATAGDLVFIGATADATFRAFDSRTGDLRYSSPLPASAYAAPMTYSVGGRQYVLIAASGGGLAKVFGFDKGPMSDSFICFALPEAEKGFKPLFDGKTLNGWEGDQATWRVEDGAIVAGSLDKMAPENQFLCTTTRYRDFNLRLQFKIEGTEGYINGGIQFRSKRVTNPPNEVSGFQYEVDNENAGFLYDEARRDRWLTPPNTAYTQSITRHGDWNDVEITCRGSHIQTWLNGYPVADYTESDLPSANDAGVIAVQIHGNGKTKVAYRNTRMKPFDKR
jgi:quinoprotein glucose dehydrogenase